MWEDGVYIMSVCATARRALPALCLTGSFSFVLMLMFAPLGLTAVASGDNLPFEPYAQTLATSVAACVAGIALLLFRARTNERTAVRASSAIAVVCSLLSCMLIVLVRNPATPMAVSLLMAVSSIAQLYLGAHAYQGVGVPATAISIACALLLATMAGFIAEITFSITAWGTLFLAIVSLVCSLAMTLVEHSRIGQTSVGDEGATHDRADTLSLLGDVRHLRYDWQPLFGGVVCALSFGLMWNQHDITYSTLSATASFGGRALGATALIAVFAYRASHLTAARFEYALLAAAGLGVLVWSISGGVLDSPVLMAVASVSQALFLGLLWIETLCTNRELERPGVLPVTGTIVFFAAFSVGSVVGQFLAPIAITALVPLLLLAYLFAMVFSTLRHGKTDPAVPSRMGTAPEGPSVPAHRTALQAGCTFLARRYGLSSRESELLPYLVVGLSSTTVGKRLFISPQTVKTHAHRIYAKMGIHSHDELVELFEQSASEE